MDKRQAKELKEAADVARTFLETAKDEPDHAASIAYSLLAIGTVLVEVIEKIAQEEL